MPLKTVIFDMDGVILNSEPIYFSLEKAMFRELGFEATPEELRGFVGIPDHEMWALLKSKHDIEESVDTLTQEGRRRFNRYLDQCAERDLAPGVLDFMERLRAAGLHLAVASSSSRQVIATVMGRYRIDRLIEVAVSGEDVARGKPAPDIFLKTAELMHTAPAECLVIEDSRNGVRAAKSAGIACIGYRNPDSGNQDLSGAALLIDSFEALSAELVGAVLMRPRPLRGMGA